MAKQKGIKISGALPGKKASQNIYRDSKCVSPSYTRSYPLVADHAKGVWITDVDGNQFLDFTAGIAVCSTGHCHPKVVKAIKEQASKLIHMSGTDFYYAPQMELAERLVTLSKTNGPCKVHFSNSGAEAVEAAFKLVRWYTGKPLVIAFTGAFHGRTMGALSLTGSKYIQKEGFSPLVPGVIHVPYANCFRCPFNLDRKDCNVKCVDYINDVILKTIAPVSDVAAIFVEPIQGEGGYVVPPADFHIKLASLCIENDILLVADEVQTGMGRTGKMFAMEHFGVWPDVICTAKGIASGMPLGATIAPAKIMKWPPGAHASTFGGNPVSCAAALTTLDLLEGGLIENAEKQGNLLKNKLVSLAKTHKIIGAVKGLGLMLAIEIVKDCNSNDKWPEMRDKIIDKAFEKGLLLLGCGESAIRFSPALVVNSKEIRMCANILEEVMNALR